MKNKVKIIADIKKNEKKKERKIKGIKNNEILNLIDILGFIIDDLLEIKIENYIDKTTKQFLEIVYICGNNLSGDYSYSIFFKKELINGDFYKYFLIPMNSNFDIPIILLNLFESLDFLQVENMLRKESNSFHSHYDALNKKFTEWG
jgi:hypothetical protein